MTTPNYPDALETLLLVFESLGIVSHIGGSVASSTYGIARTTMDIDIVADIKRRHVPALIDRLGKEYYISEDAITEAIDNQACFNLIHLSSMLKIDVFILRQDDYNQQAFQRARNDTLGEAPDCRPCRIASPEDVILNKLIWYKSGNEISQRQWDDVMGVLKVQGDKLDFAYMRRWAAELDITELLEKAIDGKRYLQKRAFVC